MMLKKLHIMLCAVPCMMACQSEEPAIGTIDNGSRIYLSAAIDGEDATTRTAYSLTTPNNDHPLTVAVWASTTSSSYPDTPGKDGSEGAGYDVEKHTAITFFGPDPHLLDDAIYPKVVGTPPVYFVGFHPSTSWNTDSNTQASYTFNGSQDVMFAPEISGMFNAANENYAHPAHFHFYHLLTWLKVEVKAFDAITTKVWGKITSLQLKNTQNHVEVDLSTVPDTSSPVKETNINNVKGETTFSGSANLYFYESGSDNVLGATPYALPYDDFEEAAYILCAPVDAVATPATTEYTLIVNTENRANVEIPIDLKTAEDAYYSGTTMGRQFTVQLTFTRNNIMVTAAVNDWQTGGSAFGHLTEE